MKLLKELAAIHAPAGEEAPLKEYLLDYIKKNKRKWKVTPKVYHGDGFQDCIVLVFGKPKAAVFTHLDSIGFTVKYGKELVRIGGPVAKNSFQLVGKDSKGKIDCKLKVGKDGQLSYQYKRNIDRGTSLTFKPNFKETKDYVQNCYMDNRLGLWISLRLAETLENGIIAFSCWEEHGGGSVGYLGKFIYEQFKVSQALICDITWATEGVKHGKGVAISLRDSGIPRRSYVNRIIEIAKKSKVPFQLEVESAGGSDGQQLQASPYPFDWCFIGAPESNVHSPTEKVHKADIDSMLKMYQLLMKKLT